MVEQLKSWKLALERLCAAAETDWHEAARLMAEIVDRSSEAMLRMAAAQAIPILRNLAQAGSDHGVAEAARRRLAIVLEVLHDLTTPRFGRRDAVPRPLTREERARKLLRLPLGRGLAVSEIHQAFRRAAKSVHPDAGGSEQAFLALAAARDVLMHPGSRNDE